MTLRTKQKKALVFLLVRIVLSWTTDIFLSGCPGDQSHTFVVNVVRHREHTFFVCLFNFGANVLSRIATEWYINPWTW